MQTELEVRILDINIEEIKRKLAEIEAEFISEKFQRRYVYNVIPPQDGKWIRLRDDGEKITLAVKKIEHSGIDGTKEIEVEVLGFTKMGELLKVLGYQGDYQENRRSSYKIGAVEVEIDEWPLIPPYLEVEGPSIAEIKKVIKLLGFQMSDTTSISVRQVYAKYGLDITQYSNLTFTTNAN